MGPSVSIEQTDNGWVVTYDGKVKIVYTNWKEMMAEIDNYFGWTTVDHRSTKDPTEIRNQFIRPMKVVRLKLDCEQWQGLSTGRQGVESHHCKYVNDHTRHLGEGVKIKESGNAAPNMGSAS